MTGTGLTVVGNCQAESLRLLLDPAGEESTRLPAVHELVEDDLPALRRMLASTRALVAQPVHDDYRGLPVGTAQLAALLPPGAALVVVPTVRWSGLHPHHVVHHPPDGVPGPPVVPYHDLRVLRAALHPTVPAPAPVTAAAVRAVGEASRAELARRERSTDVGVSDLLERPEADDLRTVNHPGNRLLLALARRVADRLGRPEPVDPGRRLLDSVRAPVDPEVARCWGFGDDAVRATWLVEGAEVTAADVAEHHRDWYAAHPQVAAEVWHRFAATARTLGLAA